MITPLPSSRGGSPRRSVAALFTLVLFSVVHRAAAQDLFSIFSFLCPILKILNLELILCRNLDRPSPPVKAPAKAPVKAPVPVPVKAPVPVPVPAPVKAPAAPAPAPVVPAPVPIIPPIPPIPPISVPTPPIIPPVSIPNLVPIFVQTPVALPPPVGPMAPVPISAPTAQLPTPLFALLNFPGKFNAVGSGPICITIANRQFTTNAADVSLRLNTAVIAQSSLSLSQVCSAAKLVEGLNAIGLIAKDTAGNPLEYNVDVWAGSNSITVNLRDSAGTTFDRQTIVTAILSADNDVRLNQTTSNGATTFTNLPFRSILFTGVTTSSPTSSGSVSGSSGTQSNVTLFMSGFLTPSTVANNDLSLNTTTGWEAPVATAVSIIGHIENIGPEFERRLLLKPHDDETDEENAHNSHHRQLQLVNNDIEVTTGNRLGETRLSRCFQTRPGSRGVLVRYRFETREYDEYFGAEYIDYFSILIRSLQAGGVTSQANTMNGLGRNAFSRTTKSTAWRRALLPININGDVVQVDVTVANVVDGFVPSKVVVDFVQEVSQSLCIYTNVADGVGVPSLAQGHTALLFANNTDLGVPANITTYGLWPDTFFNASIDTVSDVRVNFALDNYINFPYVYCEMVTDREAAAFRVEAAIPVTFTCSENAARWATRVFKLITGTTVNGTDVSGLTSSRRVGRSIRTLNGNANLPPGGLPFPTSRRRLGGARPRENEKFYNHHHRALQVNSSGSCFT